MLKWTVNSMYFEKFEEESDGCVSNVTLNKSLRSNAETRDLSCSYCDQQYLRSFCASIRSRELFYLSRITMCFVFSASVETRIFTY